MLELLIGATALCMLSYPSNMCKYNKLLLLIFFCFCFYCFHIFIIKYVCVYIQWTCFSCQWWCVRWNWYLYSIEALHSEIPNTLHEQHETNVCVRKKSIFRDDIIFYTDQFLVYDDWWIWSQFVSSVQTLFIALWLRFVIIYNYKWNKSTAWDRL